MEIVLINNKTGVKMTAEAAARRLKKITQQDGLVKDLRTKQAYEKPCQRRKRKMEESRTRRKNRTTGSYGPTFTNRAR